MVHSLHLLNICGKLVICQTLCYTYLYSKITFLPKRRHSLWDWIPTGHEPQANDKQKYFENDGHSVTRSQQRSFLRNQFCWEMLLPQALHCDENKWPWPTYFSEDCPCPGWKRCFCSILSSLACSTGSELAPNPTCSRKSSHILKIRKGRTQKGKKHFPKLKSSKDNKWPPGLSETQAFDTSTKESLSLPCWNEVWSQRWLEHLSQVGTSWTSRLKHSLRSTPTLTFPWWGPGQVENL